VSTAFGYSFAPSSIFVANKKQVWYVSRFFGEFFDYKEEWIGEFLLLHPTIPYKRKFSMTVEGCLE